MPSKLLNDFIKAINEKSTGAFLREEFAGPEDVDKFMGLVSEIDNFHNHRLSDKDMVSIARLSFALLDYAAYSPEMNLREDKGRMRKIAESAMKNCDFSIKGFGEEKVSRILERITEALKGTGYMPNIDDYGNFRCMRNTKEQLSLQAEESSTKKSRPDPVEGRAAGGGGRMPTRERSDGTGVAVGGAAAGEVSAWASRVKDDHTPGGAKGKSR